jgi:hypothetical protein
VSNTPKDECFTFGQHVATKLQKFDNKVRSVVMHLMSNIIFEAEMGKYNQYNNLSGQTSSPSVYDHEPSHSSYVTRSPSPTYSTHSYQSIQSQDLSNTPLNYVTSQQPSPLFSEGQAPMTALQDTFDIVNT